MLRSLFPLLLLALVPLLAVGTAHAEDDAPAAEAPAVVTVPSVVGLTRAEAEAKLADLGLRFTIDLVVETAIEADRVVGQDPASGGEILRGATIELRVSKAATEAAPAPEVVEPPAPAPEVEVEIDTLIRLPDLRGRSRREARDIARELGLRFASFPVRSHERRYKVLSQTPRRGSLVRAGSYLTVRYSDGSITPIDPGIGGIPIDPEPRFAEIPNLIGVERGVARSRLLARGLRVRMRGPSSNPTGATRTRVIRTNPVAGMNVSVGTRVEVTWEYVVELTPIPTPTPTPTPAPGGFTPIPMPLDPGAVSRMMTSVPDLHDLTWAAAKIKLAAAGLKIGGTEPDRRMQNRVRVRTQSVAKGKRVFRGSTVRVGYVLPIGR